LSAAQDQKEQRHHQAVREECKGCHPQHAVAPRLKSHDLPAQPSALSFVFGDWSTVHIMFVASFSPGRS
jgi:hypothetical protein